MTTGWIYLQIVVGATMRHTDAGLAIPDFPLAFGHLLTPHWDAKIAVHSPIASAPSSPTFLIVATTAHVFYRNGAAAARAPVDSATGAPCGADPLGAQPCSSGKHYVINSLHVVTSASVLATSLVLTLRAHRSRYMGGVGSRSQRVAARDGGARPIRTSGEADNAGARA